jgi:hypothetical protein
MNPTGSHKPLLPGGVFFILALVVVMIGSGFLLGPFLSLMNWFALHH